MVMTGVHVRIRKAVEACFEYIISYSSGDTE